MASNSSIKMITGAAAWACRKRSRTRLAPTPTIISTNSLAPILKNGTAASPATALASSVLPVPGAPTSRTPLGAVPPKRVYDLGSFKKSTISTSSAFPSSIPATSSKVALLSPGAVWSYRFARLLPRPKTPPPAAPAARRESQMKPPIRRSVGPKLNSSVVRGFRASSTGFALMTTAWSLSSDSNPRIGKRWLDGGEVRDLDGLLGIRRVRHRGPERPLNRICS